MTKILFLCVANSARSQIAEGLAKQLLGRSSFEIQSAGSNPSGSVHQDAVVVMNEIGIDISKQTSKFYDDLAPEFLSHLDYVVTLCAEEVCPALATTAKRLHWAMPDPAGEPEGERLTAFRNVRDAIKDKMDYFSKN